MEKITVYKQDWEEGFISWHKEWIEGSFQTEVTSQDYDLMLTNTYFFKEKVSKLLRDRPFTK